MDEGPVQAMFKATKNSVEPLAKVKVDEPLPWFGRLSCSMWKPSNVRTVPKSMHALGLSRPTLLTHVAH